MFMSLKKDIEELTLDLFPKIVSWRRHIHSNPELAFNEYETAKFVSSILTEYNIEHKTGVAKTGIVALIKGNNPKSKCVAFRADLDALPITETNTFDYSSKNNGIMHACGHDYHTATLLGAGILLHKLKSHFNGTIKLIFQPSEEKLPGGAKIMIDEGVLENPKVDFIIGQHVTPEVLTGRVGITAGKFMASADEIYLTIKGKGGHAAFPERLNDPVITSAYILTGLQQIVSRKKGPFVDAVLSFGKILANGATNIIPNEVKIDGTLRTMNEEWRFKAHKWIKEIAENTAKASGCICEVDIVVGYPCLINDVSLTKRVQFFAKDILTENNVFEIDKRMGAEDFSFYTQKIPGCFVRVGTGSSPETQNGLHTPNFNIDEEAIKTSVKLFVWLGLNL